MSDTPLVANDLGSNAPVRRAMVWSRRRAKSATGGGAFYGRAMARILTAGARRHIEKDAGQRPLEALSAAALHEIIAKRVSAVRSGDSAAQALDPLAAGIGEAAVRAGLSETLDPVVVFAAARMLALRNVAIAEPARRALALVIAACGAALLGERLHVVSVDDARARTVFETASALYKMLGITAGYVDGSEPAPVRRVAYRKTLVHIGVTTLAGDHLSDLELVGSDGRRLKSAVNLLTSRRKEAARIITTGATRLFAEDGDRILGNLGARVVTIAGDEMIFERTQFAEEAIAFARHLLINEDFTVEGDEVRLTEHGQDKAMHASAAFSPLWNGDERRDSMLIAALQALWVVKKGDDYSVDNGIVRPLSEKVQGLFEEVHADCAMELLVAAKEGATDMQSRRVRRSAPIRSVLNGYAGIGCVSCPGSEMAGEIWKTIGLPSIELESPRERDLIKHVTITKTAEEKYRVIARRAAAELAEKPATICVVLRNNEGDAFDTVRKELVGETIGGERIKTMSFHELYHASDDAFAGVTHIVLATTGGLDEDWRYLIERLLRVRDASAYIDIVIDEDDPVFGFLSPAAQGEFQHRVGRRFARRFLQMVLSARRQRFSEYRTAQIAHLQSMDRILAYSGDSGGGI